MSEQVHAPDDLVAVGAGRDNDERQGAARLESLQRDLDLILLPLGREERRRASRLPWREVLAVAQVGLGERRAVAHGQFAHDDAIVELDRSVHSAILPRNEARVCAQRAVRPSAERESSA